MRYFTKEWYALCQEYGSTFHDKARKAVLQKQLDAISEAYRRATERERLPQNMRESFTFHDGEILSIQFETDYILTVNSPFSPYNRIIFRNAMVKQDIISIGSVWLYEELYHHALGYEAHILCGSKSGLLDTKIICTEIIIEQSK